MSKNNKGGTMKLNLKEIKRKGIIKLQYHIGNDRYKFSLIKLPKEYENMGGRWEIYQLLGEQLIIDCERYKSKDEAINRIYHIIRNAWWIRLKRYIWRTDK